MELYCLDEGILQLVRMTWADIFALDDSQDPGADSREYHFAVLNFLTPLATTLVIKKHYFEGLNKQDFFLKFCVCCM